MALMPHRLSLVLLVSLWLLAAPARGQDRAPRSAAPTPAADEAELRRLAARYAVALAGNDQRALANIVSSASMFYTSSQTDIAEHNDAWQSVMASSTQVELRGFHIARVMMGGETRAGRGLVVDTPVPKPAAAPGPQGKASVLLTISIRALDVKTGRPRVELLNMRRVLECARLDPDYRFGDKRIERTFTEISYEEERPVWLVVGDEPDLQQLAKAVLTVGEGPEARAYMVLESAETLRRLTSEVIKEAWTYFEQEDYERGLRALRFIQVVEEEVKTKEQNTEKLRAQYKVKNALVRIEVSKKSLAKNREELAKLEAAPAEKQTQAIKDTRTVLADDVASDLSQIARYYSTSGQAGEALKAYEQSLKAYEKLGNKRMMANALEEVGRIHLEQKDEARALEYWLQSYRLGLEGQDAKDAAIDSGEINEENRGYYIEYKDELPSKAVGEFASAYLGFYDRHHLARTLDAIGDLYLKQKNYEQAVVFYRKSADQYKLMVARSDEAIKKEARDAAAGAKPERQTTDAAAGQRGRSKGLWLGSLVGELTEIADVYKARGLYDKAADYYELAAEEMQAIGKPDAAAELYLGTGMLGWELAERGEDEKAVALFERCLGRLKKLNARSEAAWVHLMLSQFYMTRGDYARGVAYADEGLAAALPLGDDSDEDDASLVLLLYLARGQSFMAQGDYAAALQEYQKARAEPASSDPQESLRFYIDLVGGSVYAAQGNEEIGLAMMSRSLPSATWLREGQSLSGMLNSVGLRYSREGNRLLAERSFNDAMKFAEEAGEEHDAASSLDHLSDLYSEQQDYARALPFLDRKRQLVEKLGDREEHAKTLARLGYLYREQKLYAPALESYEKAQRIIETLGGKAFNSFLNEIAELHHLSGDQAKALEVAERSRLLAERAGERESLWRARSIAGRAYLTLGRWHEAFQALDEAIKSIEFIRLRLVGREQDRQLFLENKLDPYQAMIELLVGQNRADEALSYAERSKARVLLDVMQFGRLNLEGVLTAEERAADAQLLGRLTKLNIEFRQEQQRKPDDQSKLKRLSQEIQRARLEYETFQAETYARHPLPRNSPAGAVPVLANDAPALLPGPGGAILEFVVTPARTYLFVLTAETSSERRANATAGGEPAQTQSGWRAYTINVTEDELAKHVRRYLDLIAPADPNQRSNDFKSQAGSLYNLLIGPAQAHLRGKSALVVVPDGILWNLPFQALQTPAQRYLLEDYTISYSPSLSVLREMRRIRDERGALTANGTAAAPQQASLLLAFGDPELGAGASGGPRLTRRDQLEPLPETATEVKSSVELYGARHGQYLIGPKATEENFKRLAGGYKMLHLATHGLINDRQPMYSQIVLSKMPRAGRTDSEDGYLEARELVRLKLNADLVILSACKTALGRVGNGEGMIGLTWSLSAAGTPTIVASQWAVNSCSTTELMIEFHRQLKDRMTKGASNVGAAEALRRAALQLLHPDAAGSRSPSSAGRAKCKLPIGDMRHPYFWAGFIVIGDGR